MKIIAIVGGGISGATACSTLYEALRKEDHHLTIHIYDQGRGLGGRTAHRAYSIAPNEKNEIEARSENPLRCCSSAQLRFDHGCQFFTARGEAFRRVCAYWEQRGWCSKWRPRHRVIESRGGSCNTNGSFFGLDLRTDDEKDHVYVGVDGMHSMAIRMLDACATCSESDASGVSVRVFRNVRVARVTRQEKKWKLVGPSGEAAAHDSSEAIARAGVHEDLGGSGVLYDAVIVTDISCSFGGWHRASAGLQVDLEFCKDIIRVPLFTTLVAFDRHLHVDGDSIDALSFSDDDIVWFASRTSSKPHTGASSIATEESGDEEAASSYDCWTLVSTPRYAVSEIDRVRMQDAETGAFIPQSRAYLESDDGPAQTMLRAFRAAIQAHRDQVDCTDDGKSGSNADAPCDGDHDGFPRAIFLSAQRWGSAFPSFANRLHDSHDDALHRKRILDVVYSSMENYGVTDALNGRDGRDFYHDDAMRLYYCGDFMVDNIKSDAGVEIGVGSAAMSAIACANYIIQNQILNK